MCVMSRFGIAVLAAALVGAGQADAKPFAEMFPEASALYTDEGIRLMDGLDYRQGTVSLGNGLATIETGEEFYYLDPKDAAYVLQELWGNPEAPLGLGMVFPVQYTPLDRMSWGIDLEFQNTGYVSDSDANSIDYDALLTDMRRELLRENTWRLQNGYDEISLVGWAAEPRYDAAGHKLYWAKELDFAASETNTLNYNLRVLGRRGVLNLNFIAGIEQLAEIETALPAVLPMVEFAEGHRYGDFDAATDASAAYGLGGLIAGGVVAKKTGFLAVALLALKKFWFVLLLPIVWLKSLIGRRKA